MRNWVESGVAFGFIEAALWTGGYVQALWGMAALAFAFVMTAASARPAEELGLDPRNWVRGWWLVPAAAGLALLMIGGGYLSGTVHCPTRWNHPFVHAGLYMTWAVIQEFLLLSFLYVRLNAQIGWYSMLATASLFSVAHIPNAALMAATFLLSLVLIAAFRRYRNLLAIGVSHAILGIALAMSMPDSIVHRMLVGKAYLIKVLS
jgi:hypothetical protein